MTTVPLKYLVDPRRPITYGIVQAGPDTPGGTPYIRPVDMTATAGVPNVEALQRTTPEIASAYKRSVVRAGDVVVSIGPSYGKVMLVPAALEGANLTQGTARVAPAEGVVSRFLYWALQSGPARQHWDVSVGGATFRALNLEPLARTPVSLAATDEQRRVADFLDCQVALLDRAIALRQQQNSLSEEQFRARLAEAYEAEVPGRVRLRLQDLLKQPPRYGVLVPSLQEAGVPFIRINDLGLVDSGEPPRAFISAQQSKEYRRTVVEVGDVLVSVVGTMGSAAIVGPAQAGSNVARAVCRLQPLPTVPSWLLRGWLSSPQFLAQAERATGSGTAQATLNMGDLRKFTVGIPEHGDLRVTAERARTLFVHRRMVARLLDTSIALLQERKQALITAAVTGQFDVTTARSVA